MFAQNASMWLSIAVAVWDGTSPEMPDHCRGQDLGSWPDDDKECSTKSMEAVSPAGVGEPTWRREEERYLSSIPICDILSSHYISLERQGLSWMSLHFQYWQLFQGT